LLSLPAINVCSINGIVWDGIEKNTGKNRSEQDHNSQFTVILKTSVVERTPK
jgi:hypothetical protein